MITIQWEGTGTATSKVYQLAQQQLQALSMAIRQFARVRATCRAAMSPSNVELDASTIKEWHFHTCFFATNETSKKEAQALRDALVEQVTADPKNFVAVCNGVTDKELPGLEGKPPPFNIGPVGPHLSGSFETWVPAESFAQVMSWFTLHRGSLSILVHPLTRYEREDHSTHAMWLGPPFIIDLNKLREDLTTPPLQYPELGLGYSATADEQ